RRAALALEGLEGHGLALEALLAVFGAVGYLHHHLVLAAQSFVHGPGAPQAHQFGDLQVAEVVAVGEHREALFGRAIHLRAPQIAVYGQALAAFTETTHGSTMFDIAYQRCQNQARTILR